MAWRCPALRCAALCFCICSAKVLCDSLKLCPFVVFATICRTRLFVASLAQTTLATLAKCRRKPIISFAPTTGVAPPSLPPKCTTNLPISLLLSLALSADVLLRKSNDAARGRVGKGKAGNFNILVDGIGAVPFTAPSPPLSPSRCLCHAILLLK